MPFLRLAVLTIHDPKSEIKIMAATIKNKIRNIRELKNYTQEYMAERLGVTQAGYSKIEKGKTSLSYEKLVEIGRILDVRVEDIISFDYDRYFNNFNKITGNNNGSILINADNTSVLRELYEDKIRLLEKLLNRTESELERYKGRFGEI